MDILSILLFVLVSIFFIKLIFIRSVNITHTVLSDYEIERRVAKGDEEAIYQQQREAILSDVFTLRHVLDTLLVVCLIVGLIVLYGALLGGFLALIILLLLNKIAQTSFFQKRAQALYDEYEDYVLVIADKLHKVLSLVREVSVTHPVDIKVHSKEELLHIIQESAKTITQEERYLLQHALQFEDKHIKTIMTPRSVVETVQKQDAIGPVLLDTLHKSGHSRFPVIDGDLDHVVGLLYAHDLIDQAKHKNKLTAEKIMEKKVFYINEEQTLPSALAGFLRVKHHLFIVVNEFQETTGIVTIEDVIETLIGRKIVDEFDQYEDLRAVAARVAKTRNKSTHSTHID